MNKVKDIFFNFCFNSGRSISSLMKLIPYTWYNSGNATDYNNFTFIFTTSFRIKLLSSIFLNEPSNSIYSITINRLSILLHTTIVFLAIGVIYLDINLSGSFLPLLIIQGLFIAFLSGSLILYSCVYFFNFQFQTKKGYYKEGINLNSLNTAFLRENLFQFNPSISTKSNINITI